MFRAFMVGLGSIWLMLVAGSSFAAVKNWNDGSDNWSNATDWTPAGVPGAGDAANIVFPDGLARMVTYDYTGPAVTLGALTIDLTNPDVNASELLILGNSLSAVSETVGASGSGVFTQSGGTNMVGALSVGRDGSSRGVYSLGRGSLVSLGSETIGVFGTAYFSQNGGINTTLGDLSIGSGTTSNGTYNLSGGVLNASNIFVGGSSSAGGGTGMLSVSDNNTIVTVPGTITVYNTPDSNVSFSGGTVNAGAMNVNGNVSLFKWSGGTLNITNDVTWDSAAMPTTTGAMFGSSVSLSPTKILRVSGNEVIGGNGAFNLNVGVGTHSVTGDITLKPAGSVSVSVSQGPNGMLSYSTFTQAGGTIVSPGFRNSSNFVYQSGSITGSFINDGTVSFGSTMSVSGTFQNDTSMTVAGNQMLSTTNGVTNYGLFTLAGGTIGFSGINNTSGGMLVAHGTINGGLVNHGTLVVDGVLTTTSVLTNDGIIEGAGTLNTVKFTNSANDNVGTPGIINATAPGATLAINNLISNPGGSVINIGPTSTFSVTSSLGSVGWSNGGTVNLQGNASRLIGATITNAGVIQGFGTISAPLSISSGGIFRSAGGELDIAATKLSFGFNVTSGPQFQILSGSSLVFIQGMANCFCSMSLSGGTFDNGNKPLSWSGPMSGFGTVRTGQTGLTISSSGVLTVSQGNMDVFGPVTNSGLIDIQDRHSAYFWSDVGGPGQFTGTGTAVFMGKLSPGNNAGSVGFDGNVTLGSSLAMQIGGTTPGTQYDQIHVLGQLSVAGGLLVSLLNGFKPAPWSSFDLMDWGTLIGKFSSISLPSLTVGQWDTSELYTNGVISVAMAGDFDHSGVVDTADYVAWRMGLGTTYTQADYEVWRAHLGDGAVAGGNGAAVTVPEPAYALILLAVGLAGRLARPRRMLTIRAAV